MTLQERGFEQFFFYGRPTEALVLFSRALMHIANDGEDWQRLRKQETLAAMLEQGKKVGGKEAMRREILTLMGTLPVVFIPNRYPYDGLFPHGSQLLHTCLWSQEAPLARAEIIAHTAQHFPGKSATIFENGITRKSIQLPHYHVVVDTA